MSEKAEEPALPKHIGIILDGNRRWAKQNGLKTLDGHRQGLEVFKTIVPAVFDKGVEYLSAFIFSTENWKRSQDEVSYLMKLVVKAAEKYLDEFHKKGIRIVILGSREKLSKTVLATIEKTETKTKNNKKGTLALCFNYGGQQEIVDAAKQIIAKQVDPAKLDEKKFEQYLYSADIPNIDLLIRTSGEHRTSGFMLWRAAYAELFFTDKYWPDFMMADLDEAIEAYQSRNRRFGA